MEVICRDWGEACERGGSCAVRILGRLLGPVVCHEARDVGFSRYLLYLKKGTSIGRTFLPM